jgi:hypothetical protein
MSSPSLSLRRELNNISNIQIGINVNSIADITNIRYHADFVTLNPTTMTDLQATRDTYTLNTINSLVSNAILNNLNVRIDSLFETLPNWLTSLRDKTVISNVISNHTTHVISNLKMNHSNGIIEYNLLRNALNFSNYTNTFLSSNLGDTNQFDLIYNTANNILGRSSKVQLFYNHSNPEDGYSRDGFFISTLANFRIMKYPIDGVSFDIIVNDNTSLIKIENTFLNLKRIGYTTSINRLSLTTQTEKQSNFCKAIIELAINYNIRCISFSNISNLLNNDNTPNSTYTTLKTVLEDFNPQWLGIIHTRRNNPMYNFNNSNCFIRDDFPLNLNNTQIEPSGGTSINTANNDNFNLNTNNLNIDIPNDFLGISGYPPITDAYGENVRVSFINLMNLLRYTKKSDMGMRFRCFLQIRTSSNDQYGNYKIIQYVNNLSLINAKIAIQIGASKLTNKRMRVLSNVEYNKLCDDYINSASNIRNWIKDDIFETFEIFNEPDMPVENHGFVRNIPNKAEEFEIAYSNLIPRLNAIPKIGDSLVLGSFAGKDFYNKNKLSWLNGKIKSLSFHVYPAGGDNKRVLKVCTQIPSNSSKCATIEIPTQEKSYIDPSNLDPDYKGDVIPASNPTSDIINKIQGRSYKNNTIALRNDHGRTIDGLMKSTEGADTYKTIKDEVNAAIKAPRTYTGDYKYGFHLNETNSIARSGAYGVSDVFASALWVIEFSLFNILYEMNRMNLHTGYTPDNAYNIIDYPDTYDINVAFDSKVNVKPLFYGYWLLHFALQCGSDGKSPKLLQYFKNSSISVWKLQNDSQYTYVGICYDNTQTFKLSIVSPFPHSSTRPRSGKLYRLVCKDGISGLKGISFGNLSFDGTNDGIPYNIANSSKVPITISEQGIQSALQYQTITAEKSGPWLYTISVKSPSAFILKI